MRKITLIILLNIACSLLSGQYSYFDSVSSQSYLSGVESSNNIEVLDDSYITWGIGTDSLQYRYFFQKYDLDGNFVSGKNYYYPNEFIYNGLTRTFQKIQGEDAFLVAVTKQNDDGNLGLVIKIDANLDTLWTKTYDIFPPETNIHSFSQSENGFLLNGSYGSSAGQRGTYLAEIDDNGELLWHSIIHPPAQGVFRNGNVTKTDNGYIVSGSMGAGNDTKGRVEFLSESGEYQSHLLGSGGLHQTYMRHIPINSNKILAWQTVFYDQFPMYPDISYAYSDINFYFIDIESEVIEEEHIFFENENFARGGITKALKSSDDEGFVFSGVFSKVYNDYFYERSFVMRTDSMMNMEWFTEFAADTCLNCTNLIWDMEIAPDGGYVMVGEVQGVNGNPYEHTWLVKVDACGDLEFNGCWPVGLSEFENQDLKFEIYPNPVQDVLNISLSDPSSRLRSMDGAEIEIINSLGQVVHRENLTPNHLSTNYPINLSTLTSGLYTLYLKSKGQVLASKKFVKE